MSLLSHERPFAAFRHELDALRGNWLWFLLLGIALVVLGMIAVGSSVAATFATVVVFGVLLILGGLTEIVGAFWTREWSGFFLVLLSGVLELVLGLFFVRDPGGAALAMTLLLACFLVAGGIFRMVGAFYVHYTSWIWPFLGGLIDLLLGLMIWAQWPFSGLWVIGLFVGISLIFRGWSWIMLALALKSIPRLNPSTPQ
jgi:uncharacterized membrane protein HdeD (DUF308 family)